MGGYEIELSVAKSFGKWRLGASFTSDSNRLVIWGPSGAGKSVTLKTIAGLITPDKGRIVVNGRVLYDSSTRINLPSQKRSVGLVFQDYALFPHLTVWQNLGFAGVSCDDIEMMAEKLEITRLLRHYPSQLSGGQKQRVALGRAFLSKPELLLLDEPFNALDPSLRRRMRYELAELLDSFDMPSIIVTHDPDDVRALGKDVAVFNEGKCVKCVQLPKGIDESAALRRDSLSDFLDDCLGDYQAPHSIVPHASGLSLSRI